MDIDFLPVEVSRLRAPLGLMSVPGLGGSLADDLLELRTLHRCGLLVSLIGDHELASRGIVDLLGEGRKQLVDVVRFPIREFAVPESPMALSPLVARILAKTDRGIGVAIHCWAGRGRTGLVAACCLAERGIPPDQAIAIVRQHRRRAVETSEQAAFVTAFARRRSAR